MVAGVNHHSNEMQEIEVRYEYPCLVPQVWAASD